MPTLLALDQVTFFRFFEPGGFAAISRGLSAAIPPEPHRRSGFRTPVGVPASAIATVAGTPTGVRGCLGPRRSGGIAALTHRLILQRLLLTPTSPSQFGLATFAMAFLRNAVALLTPPRPVQDLPLTPGPRVEQMRQQGPDLRHR